MDFQRQIVKEVDGNHSQLYKIGNKLHAFTDNHIIEIDIKHESVLRKSIKSSILNCKSGIHFGKKCHLVVHASAIYKFPLIDKPLIWTNNYSQFTGLLDFDQEVMSYTKYHNEANKFSVGVHVGQSTSILKLFDQHPQQLSLNMTQNHVLVQQQLKVMACDMYKPTQTTQIAKTAHLITDSLNCYLISQTLASKSRGVYDCTILDLHTYKAKSSLSFSEIPQKMEQFSNVLLCGFSQSLAAFDVRQLNVPYAQINAPNFSDFLWEPNIRKLFVASKNLITCYSN